MIRNYQIIEKIGKGTFGIVYKVKKFNEPLIYVIKQISLIGLTDIQINQVCSEAKILSLIKSKYVVKYYESFLEEDNLNIVMEYCDNGDLCNYLNKQKNKSKPLKEDLIWEIFIKITLGLTTMHKMKILHRDLKTLNIFLKKDMEIKIGDLGVAKELNQASFANTIIGTPYYLSPEMCEDKPYNQKSDVWALGVILYELCTFRHPFDAGNHAALILKIMTKNPDPILACYSASLQKIVNSILEKQIDKRPSCFDLLNMPIIIEKAKILGLYNEIIDVCYENNNNNIKNRQIQNLIPMDSEDILLQSHLVPIGYNSKTIHVKKINNMANRNRFENQNRNIDKNYTPNNNKNYIENNNYDLLNNLNVYQAGNIQNNIQNNYMNNLNNINNFQYNHNTYYGNNEQNNINSNNYNNFDFTKGNIIIFNNNYNNLYNNNINQNNNTIYNNILINNNINNNGQNIANNINNEDNYVKVTKVYQQPNQSINEHFIEDRNINDINDSLNISVQVAPIDMDRMSDKMQMSINNSSNKKDSEDNYYNYPSNSDVPMDNCIEEECPKDNTRNKSNKLNSEDIEKENFRKYTIENIENQEFHLNEDNFNQIKKVSIRKSNSFIEKDISPIKLITNTQESINIMDNIEKLNIDDNIDNHPKNDNMTENYNYNQKLNNDYKYKKKKINLANILYKKNLKDKKENIDNKEDYNIKQFNKTSENLSSSDIFNMKIEEQDIIPIKNYLKSSNLKNSSYESDSDLSIIKDNTKEINNKENDIRKEQKIPTIDIEEKENEDIFSSINNEIYLQEEKYKNIQEDIFNLIGEKDYSNLMNLYTQIKNKDELYNEIENFTKKNNYSKIKKEKLFDLCLSLISI